ncbi:hypothetical protein MRX96_025856 [Rhipicephalus microplus]
MGSFDARSAPAATQRRVSGGGGGGSRSARSSLLFAGTTRTPLADRAHDANTAREAGSVRPGLLQPRNHVFCGCPPLVSQPMDVVVKESSDRLEL